MDTIERMLKERPEAPSSVTRLATGLFAGLQSPQSKKQQHASSADNCALYGTALLALGVVALKARDHDLHPHLHAILQVCACLFQRIRDRECAWTCMLQVSKQYCACVTRSHLSCVHSACMLSRLRGSLLRNTCISTVALRTLKMST